MKKARQRCKAIDESSPANQHLMHLDAYTNMFPDLKGSCYMLLCCFCFHSEPFDGTGPRPRPREALPPEIPPRLERRCPGQSYCLKDKAGGLRITTTGSWKIFML